MKKNGKFNYLKEKLKNVGNLLKRKYIKIS